MSNGEQSHVVLHLNNHVLLSTEISLAYILYVNTMLMHRTP